METTSLVRSIVKVICGGKTGSGFLLKGGYIVTACHVVGGGRPRFFVCDDDSCFREEVAASEQPAFQLMKEEGDLAIYKIEEERKYESRCLSLALDKAMLCGRTFSTFGFPQGNRENGNPYYSARLEDNNSANDYGVKKLTLSDPGNVSKGYSGGPVYIPGYGVVGVITQKWEEIAVGLPSSVIAEHFPDLKPQERFFPVESIDKYCCLVVHRGEKSQAKTFFDEEVAFALEAMELSNKIFLKRYDLGAEAISLKQAVSEASCTCLWIDGAADIFALEEKEWLRSYPLLLFNYGLADKPKLQHIMDFFSPAPCFPARHHLYGKIPGFHYFKAIESTFGSSSEAYKGLFEFLDSEFVSYDAKLKNLLMEFDFTAGREAIKSACRSGKRFLFHCMEGTRDCGVEVLAHHGVNIIRDKDRETKDANIFLLDWENHAPAALEELLAALHLSTDSWFASDAQRVFILQNFIAPGMDESTVEARATLINQLIEKCSNRTAPENWHGAFHFFLLNTNSTATPLYSRLSQRVNCYITPAQVISLNDDPEPVDKFPNDLTREAVPGVLRQKLEGQLPEREDCPYVGAFLRKVCSLAGAPHIYHQELTRL